MIRFDGSDFAPISKSGRVNTFKMALRQLIGSVSLKIEPALFQSNNLKRSRLYPLRRCKYCLH